MLIISERNIKVVAYPHLLVRDRVRDKYLEWNDYHISPRSAEVTKRH